LRFLVDAQLPPALARWLRERGETAEHLAELGLLRADDEAIWRLAAERGAIVVSKDEDLALRAQLRSGGPPVVWIRLGNLRTAELLRRWTEHWPALREGLERGEALLELA